jgi:hypothetical protein
MILIGLVIGYAFLGRYVTQIFSQILGSVQGLAGDLGSGMSDQG